MHVFEAKRGKTRANEFYFWLDEKKARVLLSQSRSVNAKPNQTQINFGSQVKTGLSQRGENANTNNLHVFWDTWNY